MCFLYLRFCFKNLNKSPNSLLKYIYLYPLSVTNEQIEREGQIVYDTKILTLRYHLYSLQYLNIIFYDRSNGIIDSIISILIDRQRIRKSRKKNRNLERQRIQISHQTSSNGWHFFFMFIRVITKLPNS